MSTKMYTYCNVCGDPLSLGLDRGTKPHLTFDRGLNGEGILAPLPGKRGTADIHVCEHCANVIRRTLAANRLAGDVKNHYRGAISK